MTITYSFEQSKMSVEDGKKKKIAYSIVDGDKGATYYYLSKTDDSFKKVKIMEKDGKFEVTMKVGEDEKKMSLDAAELKKLVKADKDLAFIEEHMKTKKGGKRRSSKKTSKKGGASGGKRRSSKKTTKKGGASGGRRRKVSKKVSKK